MLCLLPALLSACWLCSLQDRLWSLCRQGLSLNPSCHLLGLNHSLGDPNSNGRDSDAASVVRDPAVVAEGTRRGKDRSPFYKKAAKCPSPVEGRKFLEKVEAGQISPRCLIHCSQGGSDFASIKLPCSLSVPISAPLSCCVSHSCVRTRVSLLMDRLQLVGKHLVSLCTGADTVLQITDKGANEPLGTKELVES